MEFGIQGSDVEFEVLGVGFRAEGWGLRVEG
jgi:hypothetical protein